MMNAMQRPLISAVAVVVLLWGAVADGQIPVTDLGSISLSASNQAQTFGQMVKDYAQMLQQYQQMVQQLQTAQQQLTALTGVRSIGSALLNNSAVRQQLPSNFSSMMSSIMTTGANGGSATAQAIYSQVKATPCSSWAGSPNSLAACQAPLMLSASISDTVTTAMNSAKARVAQLANLNVQVDASIDPKATADLQARIAAEQTQLAAERTMLDYAVQIQQAELALAVQHQTELSVQMVTQRTGSCYICPP